MKITSKLGVVLPIFLFIFIFSSVLTYAQNLNIPYALSNEINVEVVPNYIRPNEDVFINLTMYTADLDSSDIAWLKDGKQILVGTGLKNFSFKAGGVGEETNIEIRVRLKNGISFIKEITLIPSRVDIIWEANSYTPPFYKGKAMHANQGVLKLVALPDFVSNGKRIDPKKLVYEWSNGEDVYQDQSGYGRSTVVVDGNLFGGSENVEVLVRDPLNNLVAQGFVNINAVNTEVVFYENSPYYGEIFNKALTSTVDLEGEEIEIIATPFFFSNANNLKYDWGINNQKTPELSNQRSVVFRKPEDTSGRSLITLNINNPVRILQSASRNVSFQFEK